jgi:hypothetical protein
MQRLSFEAGAKKVRWRSRMGSVIIPDVDAPRPRATRGPTAALILAALLIGAWITISSLNGESTSTTTTIAPVLEPGPITSSEEIAGLYFHLGVGPPAFFLFHEDGTVNISSNKDLVADRPMGIFSTQFDGTEMFITNVRLRFGCPPPDNGGTYEIHVMPSGSLQFVAVDTDTCLQRTGLLLGRRFGVTTVHFVPIT